MTPGISYVLPLKSANVVADEDLTSYLRHLAQEAEVIVVDGSPPDVFERHAAVWDGLVTHIRPDPGLQSLNGKVDGVVTGVSRAANEVVVIADDDVRYEPASLKRIQELLADYELVRPQNYFAPLVWHALWDTGRTLLNRCFGADYPGTLGVRRSLFLALGGYDGDVMFENLELMRTVEAAGGRVVAPADLFVARRPPSARHFWSQRVRQAYDDFAVPLRMVLWLALLPVSAIALWNGRPGAVFAGALCSIGLAEAGRRKAGGTAVFPAAASLMAPLWLAERAVCGWIALVYRITGRGVRYGGRLIRRAASSPSVLRQKYGSFEREPA